LALSVVASVACGSTQASSSRTPRLEIASTAPLIVDGRGFVPGERVKLLVTAGRPLARVVSAGPRGGFRARWQISTGRCEAVVVQAIGSRGSRAMVDLTAPDCAPVDQS
jgi:hypothetical protein